MNYQHVYHAGNFADVFKHIILIALTHALQNKPTPFCYLDTHAGAGCYDLSSEAAQKGKEYVTGVNKLLQQKQCPNLVTEYLNIIKTETNYPGSPLLAKHILRPQDRMVLSELKIDEYHALKKLFAGDKQVAVHHQDGYQSLKAFLPPKEKRGLILIDPPYEKSDDFATILKKLPEALDRFPNGIFALWYPIKNKTVTDRFINSLKAKIFRPCWVSELLVTSHPIPTYLNGCGLFIVNPPWQIEKNLQTTLEWLRAILHHTDEY